MPYILSLPPLIQPMSMFHISDGEWRRTTRIARGLIIPGTAFGAAE